METKLKQINTVSPVLIKKLAMEGISLTTHILLYFKTEDSINSFCKKHNASKKELILLFAMSEFIQIKGLGIKGAEKLIKGYQIYSLKDFEEFLNNTVSEKYTLDHLPKSYQKDPNKLLHQVRLLPKAPLRIINEDEDKIIADFRNSITERHRKNVKNDIRTSILFVISFSIIILIILIVIFIQFLPIFKKMDTALINANFTESALLTKTLFIYLCLFAANIIFIVSFLFITYTIIQILNNFICGKMYIAFFRNKETISNFNSMKIDKYQSNIQKSTKFILVPLAILTLILIVTMIFSNNTIPENLIITIFNSTVLFIFLIYFIIRIKNKRDIIKEKSYHRYVICDFTSILLLFILCALLGILWYLVIKNFSFFGNIQHSYVSNTIFSISNSVPQIDKSVLKPIIEVLELLQNKANDLIFNLIKTPVITKVIVSGIRLIIYFVIGIFILNFTTLLGIKYAAEFAIAIITTSILEYLGVVNKLFGISNRFESFLISAVSGFFLTIIIHSLYYYLVNRKKRELISEDVDN